MYKYGLSDSIIRISDNATIPRDPDNRSYQELVEWMAAGNTPDPYIVPPLTLDQQNDLDAKNYAKLKALMNMTPAQVQAWVQANVTNLAQAQDAIATLAIAISRLARRI